MKDELYHYQDIEDLSFFLTIDVILDVLKKEKISTGDRLPNEKTLAEKAYSNRSSLREVLRVMEAFGVVSSRRGVGNILTNDIEAGLMNLFLVMVKIEEMPLSDISRTRSLLEGGALLDYLDRKTPEDIGILKDIHQKMVSSYNDIEQYLNYHMAFHEELLKYSGNLIVSHLVKTAIRLLDNASVRKAEALYGGKNTEILRENDSHKKILEAIENDQREEAVALLKEHIVYPLIITENN